MSPVNLEGYLNNVGITPSRWPTEGGFNIWSNTFPAEELPARGSIVDVGGVAFIFPAMGPGGEDNLRCRGQRLNVPVGEYDWIYLLAAAERRTEDAIALLYTDSTVRRQWLRVSDFWPETPARFGEVEAYRCSRMLYPRHSQANMAPVIWRCRVPVSVGEPVEAIGLPDNPAIHIFAVTLVGQS
ncbi:MAG TPA: hypothetical protein VFC19_36170 [Candidatus Limnocylindrales bacterium]|nr:hypothetical protein [Candidatus Limnocylindrales bacterium]